MNELFATFLSSLVSLTFCMLIGYVCRKIGLLDDRLNAGLTALLVKVTLPCTVFISLMRPFSRTLLTESVATFLLSAAVYLCGGLVGVLLARLLNATPDERRVWQFALIFANVGYMGFPVSQAVFGIEGLIYTSMANASFNLLAFTVGVRLFNPPVATLPADNPSSGNHSSGDRSIGTHTSGNLPAGNHSAPVPSTWRLISTNPALIVTLAGFICFVTGFRLPEAVNNGISMMGAMSTPVSMLLVGSILAKSRLRALFTDLRTLPVIAVRLALLPLAAFFVLRIFVANPLMLGVIVVLSAMPVASLTVIFAEQYKGDTALASKLVALSSLLCIFTVPLLSLFGVAQR